MKKLLVSIAFSTILIAFSIGTFSSCEGVFKDLTCPSGKKCPDDTPYWGGGTLCYASKSQCETNYDKCYDCTR